MPSSTLVLHQKERQMKQPMGPPAGGGDGRTLSAEKIVHEPRRAPAAPRGMFYVGSAVVLLLLVLLGFAPTFYLRAASAPELSWRVLVHGLILTAWFLTFALQAALVAGRRTDLHRALGWAGGAIGLAVIISGGMATPYWVAEIAAQGRLEAVLPTVRIIAWSNTASIVAFAILLVAAIVLRRRPDAHKRLMLLASISIIQPALARIFRWPVFEAPGMEGVWLAVAASFVLAGMVVGYDLLSRKSSHPATVAGAALFVGLKLGGVLLLAPSALGPWLVRAMLGVVS
jgi:hypothetical protein